MTHRSTLPDVLLYNLPLDVAEGITYPLVLPPNVNWDLSMTCGTVTVNMTDSTAVLDPNSLYNNQCSLKSGATTIWKFGAIFTPLGSYKYKVVNGTFDIPTNTAFMFRFPGRSSILRKYSNAPHTSYSVSPALPSGLMLDADRGIVMGTPIKATPLATYEFYLKDQFSGDTVHVATLKITVQIKSSSSIPIYAIIAPIAVVILAIIAYFFWRRHDRRKKYHIFISYRVATDAKLAEFLCYKLQQHFLSTGHRVRAFWDKQDLQDGQDWEKSFIKGLKQSCVYLPLISVPALENVCYCFLFFQSSPFVFFHVY